jgi:hypothetical protein
MADSEKALRDILDRARGVDAFMSFLREERSENELVFVIAARRLVSNSSLPKLEKTTSAEELCAEYPYIIGAETTLTGDIALEHVLCKMEATIQDLASHAFVRFIDSEGCAKFIETTQPGYDAGATDEQLSHLVWGGYHIPNDVSDWVKAFILMAEALPVCIVIADATAIKFPLFFVCAEI